MEKAATKKATRQLQQLFDFLGESGGTIKTDDPDRWWNLTLEIEGANVAVGLYSFAGGDVMYDPLFHLSVEMDSGKIAEVRLRDCEETTMFGTTIVDEEDNICGLGLVEKDSRGLVQRFSDFMDTITESGPYLKTEKA